MPQSPSPREPKAWRPAKARRTGDGPDRVYAALRRDIIEQGLAAGTKLPELDVAERFGVSRTIVRAAFTRLTAEGLLVRASNQGARVALPSQDEAADILDLRRSIEGIVIDRLFEAGRPRPDVAALRAHVAEEERALAAGPAGRAESVRLSGEFHVRLAEAAGSPLLARYVSELVSRCSLLLSDHRLAHSGHCAVAEHCALIDCIERGDKQEALTQMHHHLSGVADRALRGTAGDGDPS
ncbi:transcriptional regulator [Acidisoma sp. 7E03]